MRHIAYRIDFRVGTPGSDDLHGLFQECRERLLKAFLDADGIGLVLPPAEIRPVVREFYEVAHLMQKY